MHNWQPPGWTELDQLCGSKPFKLFCASPLPTAHDRVICQACGLETDESGHGHPARAPAGHTSAEMWQHTPPEQRHEQMGHPPWEAPYVWETHYMEDL